MLLLTESFDWYTTANLLVSSSWSSNFCCDQALSFVSIGNQPETDSLCNVSASGKFRASGLGDPVNLFSEADISKFLNNIDPILILGYRFRPNIFPFVGGLFSFLSGDTNIWYVFDNLNHLELYLDGVLIGTSSYIFVSGIEVVFETKVNVTDGSVEVRVNSVSILTVTGLSLGSSPYTGIDIGMVGNFFVADDQPFCMDFDDIYVLNGIAPFNDFLGKDYKIHVLNPNADGALVEFIPIGTITNFDADNVNDGDTKYVKGGAELVQRDRYKFPVLPNTIQQVVGLSIGYLVKNAELCPRNITGVSRVSSVDYEGDPMFHGPEETEYSVDRSIFALNPDTGLQWTVPIIDASQFGVDTVV